MGEGRGEGKRVHLASRIGVEMCFGTLFIDQLEKNTMCVYYHTNRKKM